jgi:hypothetical protein
MGGGQTEAVEPQSQMRQICPPEEPVHVPVSLAHSTRPDYFDNNFRNSTRVRFSSSQFHQVQQQGAQGEKRQDTSQAG